MFLRRMKFLQVTTVVLLTCVLITLGIVVLTTNGNHSESRIAGESTTASAADAYAAATQADYDAVKRQASGEYLLIENGVQLASVFRYGGDDALSRKFKVNFTGIVKMNEWTVNGGQVTPVLGAAADAAFTGEFDFNGITVETDNPSGQGLFPYVNGGKIRNLNIIQNMGGCTISKQIEGNAVLENITAEIRISENYAPSTPWGGIVNENGLLSDVNVAGGTIRNCRVTLSSRANKNLLIQNVGLIAGRTVGGRIENCATVLGEGNFSIKTYGGVVYIAADNAVVTGCKAYMLEESVVYTSGNHIGGLCGWAQDTVSFVNCVATFNHDGWNKGASTELFGVGGLIGVMNNTDASKKIIMTDCAVSGDRLYGGAVSGGIVGAQNSSAEVTSCKSKFNRIYASTYAGIMFGGDGGVGWTGSNTGAKNFLATNCVSSGDVYAKAIIGGFTGSLERGCYLTLKNCSVYGNLYYDASIYSRDSRARQYFCGYLVYSERLPLGQFIAQGCSAYVTLPSESATNSGDLFGNGGSGVTVTVEQSTYTKSLGTDYAYQSSFSGKTVLTGMTSVTEAVAAQKRSEFESAFSLQKQLLRLEVSGTVATLNLDAFLSGYTVRALYVSVNGISSEGVTQLVHEGKVVGYMGAAFALGSGVSPTGNRIVFEFEGVPQNDNLCAVKIVLTKGDSVVSAWVNAAGDEVQLSS